MGPGEEEEGYGERSGLLANLVCFDSKCVLWCFVFVAGVLWCFVVVLRAFPGTLRRPALSQLLNSKENQNLEKCVGRFVSAQVVGGLEALLLQRI